MALLKTSKQFFKECLDIHNNKYDYSNSVYINHRTRIKVICPVHGEFEQMADSHVRGCGCPACKKVKPLTTEDFIDKVNKIHNNRYLYSKTVYVNAKTKILITCKEHGEFWQSTSLHLRGKGCPKCGIPGGYHKKDWVRDCNKNTNSDPRVYIIKCFNNYETFIKIGITYNPYNKRFNSPKVMPYSYEVLKEIKGSPDFVFDKEKELHRLCKNYKYTPLISFAGQTECFTLEALNLLL